VEEAVADAGPGELEGGGAGEAVVAVGVGWWARWGCGGPVVLSMVGATLGPAVLRHGGAADAGGEGSLPSPAMADETCTVLYNPRCSKCRQARDLLAEKGVDADLVHYLDDTPSRDEIARIAGLLGVDDPREMMRTGEPVYRDLGLKTADREALFDAMAEHPILIERPIVIAGDRAVIARPPERLLEVVAGA
jgi:arsenate reductase (glutaredoxin)